MPEKAMVLMVVKGDKGAPSLADAARQLKVTTEDIDSSYGVVAVDPDQGLYTVRVLADRVKPDESSEYRGPFSDPEVGPVGPVK
jgi:hypothetical protein